MLPSFAYSENKASTAEPEKYCTDYKPTSWEQRRESEFTKEKVIKRLHLIEKQLNGEIETAPEFDGDSLVILEGGLLRYSVEVTKNNGHEAGFKYYREKYCNFLNKKAYVSH